ncbi:hypothetical protein V8F33_000578 [Rhypophila sp. PSN 637]
MADEVAEDYRQALEDLSINSRLEISTLTNIARENADFGHAIADVLEKHIKKVPAQRTLPALYVLDSIVKNVPTPYALYFGPRLYSIFMGAYTKVDNPTRRKMDEMLRTWKEPVPGSISTKPVFPPEIVRNIENALIGARTAALQAQQNSFLGQQQLRRRGPPPGAVPNRDTPTPPNMRSPYPGPNGQGPPTDPNRNQPYPMRPLSATGRPVTQTPPTGPPYHQRDIYGAPPAPEVNLEKLRDDIQQLIVAETAEFARDPHDASKQTRLRAFLELQTQIQRPDVTREQLMLVRDQVAAELAVKNNMRHGVHHPPPPLVNQYPPAAVPYAAPLVMLPQQQQQSRTPVPQVPAAPPPAVSLDSILGQGALATLLGGLRNQAGSVPPSASVTPQPVPLPLAVPAVAAPVRSTPPVPAAQPPKDPNALLAMLRQSGILSAANTPTPPPGAVPTSPQPIPAVPTPVPAPTPVIRPPVPASSSGGISLASLGLGGLSSLLPQLQQKQASVPPPFHDQSIYLKRYMPHLLSRLHEELGSHCTQCGRRFRNDDAGRRLKAAHMDWHFRVHQRIADAEKRGQHKSWYVGEMDWIRGREAVDVDYIAPGGGINSSSGGGGKGSGEEGSTSSGGEESESDSGSDNDIGGALRRRNAAKAAKKTAAATKGKKKKGKKGEYFPVPDGAERVTLSICPICQESFEMKWLDEEWVWMDAVKVGDRVYHASCHREASSGGGAGANGKRSTPERASGSGSGVLGKRKAEDDLSPVNKGKIKLETGY